MNIRDMRRLHNYDHRCLRSIAHVSSNNRLNNVGVRDKVLDNDGKSVDEVVNLLQMTWSRRASHIPKRCLSRSRMFTDAGIGLRIARGCQTKIYYQSMNSLVNILIRISRSIFARQDPFDSCDQ